jgi:dolichol kinase
VVHLAAQWRDLLVRESRRKAIHLTGLSVPFGILLYGKAFTAAMIALALAAALLLEAGRLKGMIRLPAVREHEAVRVAGYIYYIIGSLLTVLLFQPMVAVLSMLLLSLGDTVSGLVGSVLKDSNVRGKNEPWHVKPLPIVAAMLCACMLIGYLSSGLTHLPFRVYLAGAIGATIADSVAVVIRGRGLDDNLSIPLFSGILMSVALLLA